MNDNKFSYEYKLVEYHNRVLQDIFLYMIAEEKLKTGEIMLMDKYLVNTVIASLLPKNHTVIYPTAEETGALISDVIRLIRKRMNELEAEKVGYDKKLT